MRNLLIIFATANVLSFAWSVFGVFKKYPEKDSIRYYVVVLLSLITYFFTLFALIDSKLNNLYLQVVGLILLIFSLLLFWLSVRANYKSKLTLIFSLDQPQHLVTSGPYNWIRHPFYLSYFCCYFGAWIASLNAFLFVCFLGILLIYLNAISHEENKFLNSPLSVKYQAYMKKTGKLFPKFLNKNSPQ